MKINKPTGFYYKHADNTVETYLKNRATFVSRADIIKLYSKSDSNLPGDWHLVQTDTDQWIKYSFDGGKTWDIKFKFNNILSKAQELLVTSNQLTAGYEFEKDFSNLTVSEFSSLSNSRVSFFAISEDDYITSLPDFRYKFNEGNSTKKFNFMFLSNLPADTKVIRMIFEYNEYSGMAFYGSTDYNYSSIDMTGLSNFNDLCVLDNTHRSVSFSAASIDIIQLECYCESVLTPGHVFLTFKNGDKEYSQTLTVSQSPALHTVSLPVEFDGEIIISRPLYDNDLVETVDGASLIINKIYVRSIYSVSDPEPITPEPPIDDPTPTITYLYTVNNISDLTYTAASGNYYELSANTYTNNSGWFLIGVNGSKVKGWGLKSDLEQNTPIYSFKSDFSLSQISGEYTSGVTSGFGCYVTPFGVEPPSIEPIEPEPEKNYVFTVHNVSNSSYFAASGNYYESSNANKYVNENDNGWILENAPSSDVAKWYIKLSGTAAPFYSYTNNTTGLGEYSQIENDGFNCYVTEYGQFPPTNPSGDEDPVELPSTSILISNGAYGLNQFNGNYYKTDSVTTYNEIEYPIYQNTINSGLIIRTVNSNDTAYWELGALNENEPLTSNSFGGMIINEVTSAKNPISGHFQHGPESECDIEVINGEVNYYGVPQVPAFLVSGFTGENESYNGIYSIAYNIAGYGTTYNYTTKLDHISDPEDLDQRDYTRFNIYRNASSNAVLAHFSEEAGATKYNYYWGIQSEDSAFSAIYATGDAVAQTLTETYNPSGDGWTNGITVSALI